MRDFYWSLGVTAPMSVIPNGVDLERFRSNDLEREKHLARQILGISTMANVVLFVGSIIHRKGVDLLLSAFTRVAAVNPRAELVLVGPRDDGGTEGERAFQARIDELVRKSGVAERIRFTGHVAAVDTHLRAADVLVLPSSREGMGNVVLEAMATGVPTVLTPYLGLPDEFGAPGVQYVLSAPEADCLATHIQSLLEDMGMSDVIDAYARIYHDLAAYGTVMQHNRMKSWIDRSRTH
jgi:glycosyltransferase involved in cell wall biosynthesis